MVGKIAGASAVDSDLHASSSIIRMHPTDPDAQTYAVRVLATAGNAAGVELRQMTLDGQNGGPGRQGIVASSFVGGLTSVAVDESIIRRFPANWGDLVCFGAAVTLTVRRSNSGRTRGCATAGWTGNIVGGETGWAAPDATDPDYSLVPRSPLIDLGSEDPPAGDESQTDFGGDDRLFDGDGDGRQERDAGAFRIAGDLAA